MLRLLGLILIVLGLVWLDLSTLPIKKDLYFLYLLGTFNNLFSLNYTTAVVQSFMCASVVCYGVYLTVK
jgi:hypothetical protein|tara:strand:- start:233 stop:439 length:207 start_codon:yes stop_codon:yes gene_type:complete